MRELLGNIAKHNRCYNPHLGKVKAGDVCGINIRLVLFRQDFCGI